MGDVRKNRHEILHSSIAKTDGLSGHQTQASHQMCLPQHCTALSSCSLEATLHLLGNPSEARPGAFNPEDLYCRHAPQDHWGEQAQPREWLAKTGRRKKHPKGKSQVLRGTEPAEELLQTTLMLPWEPPWDRKGHSQLPNPCPGHLGEHRRRREPKSGQKPSAWVQTVSCAPTLILLLPSSLLAQLSPRVQRPRPLHP